LARFRNADAVVILPTLNEEEGLARTLGELPFGRFDESGRKVRTLVIDGGSTDGTLRVARDWNIPVLRQSSEGKGAAMLEAVAWVHRLCIPFVVVLDADATYPPERILPTLDLLRGSADLVIGVRRPVWGPPSDFRDLVHRVGNLWMSCSASLLTQRPILDLCSGFWGVSTERFMELRLDDSGFAIEAQLILRSIRRGLRIHQISVDYHERVGEPKLRAIRDGSRIFRTILRYARTGHAAVGRTRMLAPVERNTLSVSRSIGSGGTGSLGVDARPAEARRLVHWLPTHLPKPSGRDEPPAWMCHSTAISSGNANLLDGRVEEFSATSDRVSPRWNRSDEREVRTAVPARPSFHREPVLDFRWHPTPVDAGRAPSLRSHMSGGRISGRPVLAHFPALLVLTSRLNFEPERQRQILSSANGVRGKEPSGTPIQTPPGSLFHEGLPSP
jgi:dolichol-phosphate hexosyltransferase